MHEGTDEIMRQYMNLQAMAPPSTSGRAPEPVNMGIVDMQDFDFSDNATPTPPPHDDANARVGARQESLHPETEGEWRPQKTRDTLGRSSYRHSQQPNPVHPFYPLVVIDNLPGHVYLHQNCVGDLAVFRALYPPATEPADPTRLRDVNSVLGQHTVDDDANMVLDECALVQRSSFVNGLDSDDGNHSNDDFDELDELNGGDEMYSDKAIVDEDASEINEVSSEEGIDPNDEGSSSSDEGSDSSDSNASSDEAGNSSDDKDGDSNGQADHANSGNASDMNEPMPDADEPDSPLTELDSDIDHDMEVILPQNIQQVVDDIKSSATASSRGLPNKMELARRWGPAYFGSRGDLLKRGAGGLREYTREQLDIPLPIWDYLVSKDRK